MTFYDLLATLGSVVVVIAIALTVGCTMDNGGMSTRMPYLEMDYAPAASPQRSAPAPNPVATHTPTRTRSAWDAPRSGREWRYIVIHHSATEHGNADEFDTLHRQKGWDELGYHFVITNGHGGPDGQVQVGSRWRKQKHGAHTGGTPGNEYNEHGIGICLVGNFMHHRPTHAQLRAVTELTEYLAERYNISSSHIIAHRDAPNQNTECCGRVFYSYVHSQLKRDVERQLASR